MVGDVLAKKRPKEIYEATNKTGRDPGLIGTAGLSYIRNARFSDAAGCGSESGRLIINRNWITITTLQA